MKILGSHPPTRMASLTSNFKKLSLHNVTSADESVFPPLTNEQKALALQYQTLSSRLGEPEAVASLNANLKTKTFIVGNVPSKADLVVFANVLHVAKSWTSTEDVAAHRHILRWADLVQNQLVDVPAAEKLVINHDIEIPREVKEKKKPAKPEAAGPEKDAKKEPTAEVKETKKNAKKNANKAPLTEEEKKASAEAAKAKKAAKAAAKAEADAKKAASVVPPSPALIDFRVGFIEKAIKHPDADSLYVSTIDMGDAEGPRTICSGLVKYIPIEDMQQRYIVTVANLKPVSMRGIKSYGMVLCASNAETVEFVNPPAGSKAGDKLFFEGYNGEPEKQLNPKKKVWETVQAHFSTSANLEVTYTPDGKPAGRLVNERNELCKNPTIVGADVK